MAGAKNHDYHILPPSVWPLVGSMSALVMAVGGVMWMHGGHVDKPNGGGWIFFIGLAGLLFTFYSWWAQVIAEGVDDEATLAWLQRATFVGVAARTPDRVAIGFHEVL